VNSSFVEQLKGLGKFWSQFKIQNGILGAIESDLLSRIIVTACPKENLKTWFSKHPE